MKTKWMSANEGLPYREDGRFPDILPVQTLDDVLCRLRKQWGEGIQVGETSTKAGQSVTGLFVPWKGFTVKLRHL